jgi:Ala-tRNA(Pro) deacylase
MMELQGADAERRWTTPVRSIRPKEAEGVMAISQKLRNYMHRCGVAFEEVSHDYTPQAAKAAEASHVSGNRVAKGVLVLAGDEYLLAVVPASRHVKLQELERWLGRPVSLAGEQDSRQLFADCELGAIPPIGAAFGLEAILDDELLSGDDIYFEGGDHRTLVHVNAGDWRHLVRESGHCAMSA